MILFLRRIYTFWAVLVFVLGFLMLYPFFMLFLISPKTHQASHFCYKIWAVFVFTLCGTPFLPERHFKQNKKQAYIFCANHTSYADIAMLYLTIQVPYSFIGKSSLAKVPMFGYLYKTLHILVDRKSAASKRYVVEESLRRIDKGESIMIFPEGTIPKNPPKLGDFKEGAFKMAIEKQIPIVPITIPNNWIILSDDGKWLCNWRPFRVIVHKPIETKGLTLENLEELKKQTFDVINNELIKRFPSNDNR